MTLFDPWLDARRIADSLALPGAELITVLAAEAWCSKCRLLRPLFENNAAADASDRRVWLWLDLEEHADFIDGFIPDDLPLLLHYQQGILVKTGVWRPQGGEKGNGEGVFEAVSLPSLPALWQSLCTQNWACS